MEDDFWKEMRNVKNCDHPAKTTCHLKSVVTSSMHLLERATTPIESSWNVNFERARVMI